ncbi:MAG: endonuclease domain-containing protein [Candidatus Uhrbacteria bacterium]|nr:endonuclease domain-containing protein [Candidatus Uhrbacteria bacterium]
MAQYFKASPSPSMAGGEFRRVRGSAFTVECGKVLRKEQTLTERLLWQSLKGRGLGVKFRRQHGIDQYIVDFYCDSARLIIELDGDVHLLVDVQQRDEERQEFLVGIGYNILRFSNKEVLEGLPEVLAEIAMYLK